VKRGVPVGEDRGKLTVFGGGLPRLRVRPHPYAAKLSKMQKAILLELLSSEAGFHGRWVPIGYLSWRVIRRLGNPRHVWDMERAARELAREDPAAARVIAPLLPLLHRQRQLQTESFRAAFSRSLRRLKERGLVELWGWGRRKTMARLTEAGRAAAAQLSTAAKAPERKPSEGG
jgi:hypothetical protein